MLEISIYLPKRRAVRGRGVSMVGLGIGNMISRNTYVPLIDIDRRLKPSTLNDIIRCGCKLLNTNNYLIVETMKGYHIIWLTTVSWKMLNRLWTRLKEYIDRRWITLQRKRGYGILRVRGKYNEKDLKPVVLHIENVDKKTYVALSWLRIYGRGIGCRPLVLTARYILY